MNTVDVQGFGKVQLEGKAPYKVRSPNPGTVDIVDADGRTVHATIDGSRNSTFAKRADAEAVVSAFNDAYTGDEIADEEAVNANDGLSEDRTDTETQTEPGQAELTETEQEASGDTAEAAKAEEAE